MSERLRILSWNVHYPDFARNSSFVIRQLENEKPFDVICLQEYVAGADGQFKQWLESNNYDITYLPFAHRGKLSQGVMIATKKTLLASSKTVTLREDGPKLLRPFNNVRGIVSARIRLDGQEIVVINTHLTYPRIHTREMRRREFASLKEYLAIESAKNPIFLCGDFNFIGKDSRRIYLEEHYQSFTGSETKTWNHRPKMSPLQANLDYIFWKEGTLHIDAHVGEANTSDHRPLIAEVSWHGSK